MRKIFNKFNILIFVLLNIILPTVDVITDFLMIVKLFRGAYGCVNPRWWSEDHKQWQQCLVDPRTFCVNSTLGGINATCERDPKRNFAYSCRSPYDWSNDYQDWKACREGPAKFCPKKVEQETDAKICQFERHPLFGISMMTPFLVNYIFCFLTWWRLEKQRKKTFFFPLIDMYTQLGKCD